MNENPIRFAMWSGPRNISTAMMRSFEARGDTFVTDEPFYSHYLLNTGFEHPGKDEIIETHESDPEKVIDWLTGPIPDSKSIWYQKQMTHHMLPNISRDWLKDITNVFLIRDPKEVILSYLKKNELKDVLDTGFPQQSELFDHITNISVKKPAVIDAKDLLNDPKGIFGLLCDHVGIDFTEKMLSWEPGLRNTDGIWAKHWYDSVARSTGFSEHEPRSEQLSHDYDDILEKCYQIYHQLFEERLHT